MPKYLVKMNYVIAYSTEFVIDSYSEDEAHDVISNMEGDFLEKHLPWTVSEYQNPIISELDPISDKKTKNKFVVNSDVVFMEEYNETKKDVYETD